MSNSPSSGASHFLTKWLHFPSLSVCVYPRARAGNPILFSCRARSSSVDTSSRILLSTLDVCLLAAVEEDRCVTRNNDSARDDRRLQTQSEFQAELLPKMLIHVSACVLLNIVSVNVAFYSILFYSILFYSILFYLKMGQIFNK